MNRLREWAQEFRSVISHDYLHEFGYFKALDDVFDSLDRHNPCHDEVRETVWRLRKEYNGNT